MLTHVAKYVTRPCQSTSKTLPTHPYGNLDDSGNKIRILKKMYEYSVKQMSEFVLSKRQYFGIYNIYIYITKFRQDIFINTRSVA